MPSLKPLEGEEEKLKKYLLVFYFIIVVLLVGSFILNRQFNIRGVVSGIYIEDVVLTSGLDASGWPINRASSFSSMNKRIYCFIYFRGVFGFPMGGAVLARWYYDSEQIRGDYFHTDSEPVILWLEPLDDGILHPGPYKIEIFINQMLVRVVEFKVE